MKKLLLFIIVLVLGFYFFSDKFDRLNAIKEEVLRKVGVIQQKAKEAVEEIKAEQVSNKP